MLGLHACVVPLHFKKAIFVRTYAKTLKPWMLLSLKQTISADQWLEQAHEESHALHALYDSGYSSGLIVTVWIPPFRPEEGHCSCSRPFLYGVGILYGVGNHVDVWGCM